MLILCQHIFKTCLVSKAPVFLCCLVGKDMGESDGLERWGLRLWGVSNTDRTFILSGYDSLEMLGAKDVGEGGKLELWAPVGVWLGVHVLMWVLCNRQDTDRSCLRCGL